MSQLNMYRCTATSMDTDEDTVIAYYEAFSRVDALAMFDADTPESRGDRWIGQVERVPSREHKRGLTHKVDFDADEEDWGRA